MMRTFAMTSELTIAHPTDDGVTVTLRWDDRSKHGPSEETQAAMRAVLSGLAERTPPPWPTGYAVYR